MVGRTGDVHRLGEFVAVGVPGPLEEPAEVGGSHGRLLAVGEALEDGLSELLAASYGSSTPKRTTSSSAMTDWVTAP